jgi:hypothetical protein
MNLYNLHSERDGQVLKDGGASTTEIIRVERKYIASCLQDVVDKVQDLPKDETFKAIVLDSEGVIVLTPQRELK